MGNQPIYQRIAHLLAAIENCEKAGNTEWEEKHRDRLKVIMNTAPSGSGWDLGTKIDNESTPEELVFYGAFHHLDENGTYAGWTKHTIIVRGSLLFGINVKVTGINRNDIKDYLGDLFHSWLMETAGNAAEIAEREGV